MSVPALTVEALVKPDGTLELAERIALPPGRVQLTIVPIPELPPKDPVAQRRHLEDRFQQLAAQWRRDVGPLSSVSKIVEHPSYQAIIALGRDVVPLILRDLEREPDHWFTALRALTGADPIAPEDRGRMDRMAAAWVRWGKEHGFTG